MKRPARQACLLAAFLAAAPVGAAEPVRRSPNNDRVYRVPRASGALEIDGHLDEAAWQEAVVVELAYEVLPGENSEPPVRTEMLMLYGDEDFYVAFRAYDPDPAAIRVRITDRDRAFQDDFVGIVIDPFNDGRRGFEFLVNPLGAQMDLFFDDTTAGEDATWNAIWRSSGHVHEHGYDVEIAIPYSSLRFPKGSGELTWGFDGLRIYPRDQRYSFRSQPRDRSLDCYICQFSRITGFAGADPGRNVELNPTLTGGRTDSREQLTAPELREGDVESDPGLTLRWGVTPNLSLNATINPDFSQVEADVAQLDVNTTFALFFPETRPFFKEDADFFTTQFNLVHTRVVTDPDWGLKLTGKQGAHALGVFAATDAVTGLVLPGSQGSRAAVRPGEENTLAVVRYRRDVGGRSNVGILATAREGDEYSNRVAGVDGKFRFTSSDTVSFQLVGSRTRYPAEIVAAFGEPAAPEDVAFRVGYSHKSRNWHWFGNYQDVGAEFRADLGFMPKVNFTRADGGVERTWWPGERHRWWTQIRLGAEWRNEQDPSGIDLDRGGETWFLLAGPLQSSLGLSHGRRRRFFGFRFFEESYHTLTFNIRPSGDFFFSLTARAGDEIEFRNVLPGEQLQIVPAVTVHLGRRLQLDLSHNFNRLESADDELLFEAAQSELRLVYQLNLRSFVRLITQLTDVDRDPRLFAESKRQDLFNQLLFSYKVNPRTVIFVGYSDTSQALTDSAAMIDVDLTKKSRTIFLKLGYAWIL